VRIIYINTERCAVCWLAVRSLLIRSAANTILMAEGRGRVRCSRPKIVVMMARRWERCATDALCFRRIRFYTMLIRQTFLIDSYYPHACVNLRMEPLSAHHLRVSNLLFWYSGFQASVEFLF